jgi:hypothetical protein
MDKRHRTQSEPVREKAGEKVGAPPVSLLLHGRNEAGRHSRLPLRLFEEHQAIGLAQFHLERQGLS